MGASGRSRSSDRRRRWTGPKQISSEECDSLSPDSAASLLSWRERSSHELQSERGGAGGGVLFGCSPGF